MAFSRSTARRARSLALSPAIRLKRNVGASPHASRARASPDASGAVRAIRAFETWVRCERLRRLCNEGRRKVGVIDPLLRCGLAFDQWRPRLDPQPALVYQCRFPDGRGRPPDLFGAQRLSALFGTQNESIQQKHEPMAESLAQA